MNEGNLSNLNLSAQAQVENNKQNGAENEPDLKLLRLYNEACSQSLFAKGVLSEDTDGHIFFDANKIEDDKLIQYPRYSQFEYKGKSRHVGRTYFLDFLSKYKAIDKNNPEKGEQPCLSLPANIFNAKRGDFQDGIIYPWDIDKNPPFRENIGLPDKNEVNLADLFYLKKIKDLQIHRDERGKLVYFDKDENSYKNFYSKNVSMLFGKPINFKENDGRVYSFDDTPLLFIKKYLPLVDSLDLFQPDDFRRQIGGPQADAMFSHSRHFDKNNPYINISGEDGLVRYYMGRGKIVGTDQKMDDNLSACELDSDTIGIMENKYGKSRILYTFPKLNTEEFKSMGFADKKDNSRMVSAKDMKNRLHPYRPSDYLQQRPNEDNRVYADRLAGLGDTKFVIEFREMMAGTGVNLRQLSWTEQILAANYALETDSRQELLSFVEKYGTEGLRSFLSVESDPEAARKILLLDKKIPPKSMKVIIGKIGALNTLAVKKAEELSRSFYNISSALAAGETNSNDPKSHLFNNVYRHLFSKSQEIIKNFSDGDPDSLLLDLDRCQAEMVMLAGVLNEAKHDNVDADFDDIRGLNLSIKNFGEQLSDSDRKEIIDMAKANWSDFGNKKMFETVINGLSVSLADTSQQRCYILKYKEQTIAFVRFEKTDHNTLYAGSFNVSKDLRGLNIGKEMMEQALIKESEHNILEASASVKIPAGCAYIEKVGFVADGIIENYYDSNEDLFNIVLNKNENSSYRFRNEGKQTPIDQENIKSMVVKTLDIDKYIGDQTIVLSFDWQKEANTYKEILRKLLAKKDEHGHSLDEKDNKYIVTRYFQDKTQPGDLRYLVFEKQ